MVGRLCCLEIILSCIVICGCGNGSESNRADRKTPENLTLYKINPARAQYEKSKTPPKDQLFYGHQILGKTAINAPEDRARIFNALQDGIEASDGEQMKCFDPGGAYHTSPVSPRDDKVRFGFR